MKTKTVRESLERNAPRSRNFRRAAVAASALFLLGMLATQPGRAQIFPAQGDDSTFSMGVFRITVDPAFRPLMDPAGALVAYTGYAPLSGRLTSPLCIDNATTIGRSTRHARVYTGLFPIPIGAGSWDSIANYAAYAAIPALWAGAPAPTEEVLTEIKSFVLLSVTPGPAGKHCPPDPRIPSVPLNWPMVKAGTFAGVSPQSLGMVQENVANGAANPDFSARSFFDIFVEVNLPPLPGTVSGGAFPPTGAVLYNDSPLIITNLNLTGFPPTVVYIHGETTAVPLKFKTAKPPYWNAGDIFGYLVLAGHGTLTVDCNNPNSYSTEMLQLDISGGGLPAGLMIRESPTLASTGGAAIQPQPDGTYAIDSFFDVWTELSTDNGFTWCPATNRHKVKLVCPSPPTNNFLPPTNCYYTNLNQVRWTNCPGIIITNIVHRGWTNNFPPPTVPTTHTFNSFVDGRVSLNGGATFNSFTAPAVCTVLVSPGSDSNDAQNALLDAALGPIGNSASELAVEWLRTNTLCPSPGSTYDSVQGTNSDGSSIDVLKFVIPQFGFTVQARHFSHGNFPNAIIPPSSPNATAFYTEPSTFVNLEVSEDGHNWSTAFAQGPLQVMIHNNPGTGSTTTFDTEMQLLNLQGNSPIFGSFMLRKSPSRQSVGKHTIRLDPRGYRISSFFDVFLDLSVDGGQTWNPADRSIRVQPSAPAAAPNSIFISRDGSNIVLDWLGSFQLQRASKVTGPYSDVIGATNGPFVPGTDPNESYFRLRQ